MITWVNRQIDIWLQPDFLRPEDIASLPPDGYVPKLSDIILPSIAMATCLVVIRHLLDRFVITPIGDYLGLRDNLPQSNLPQVTVFENEYGRCQNPTADTLTILSKKSGMTERQVLLWFRKRKKQGISDLKKLQDASYHFVFYFAMSWYGIYVLWDKSWFEKTLHCWIGWPAQTVTDDIYWYYLIEFGFYMSAVYMLFTDHKRKDFTEQLVHHMVTLFLMFMSFTYNLLRIGTLVLCIHDQVDYLLALAKVGIYLKKHMMADTMFVLFIVVWIATRLVLYPYVILYSVFIDVPEYADDSHPTLKMYDESTIMMFVKIALLVLQILHLIWTVLIIKSAAAKFTKGEIVDARSDNEDSDTDENFESNNENDKNGYPVKSGKICQSKSRD